mgnify:FL=1
MKRKQNQAIYELTKLIFSPVTKRATNRLNEFKKQNLKLEIAASRELLQEERKYLHLPIQNPNAHAKRLDVLNARHRALKNELKRLNKLDVAK